MFRREEGYFWLAVALPVLVHIELPTERPSTLDRASVTEQDVSASREFLHMAIPRGIQLLNGRVSKAVELQNDTGLSRRSLITSDSFPFSMIRVYPVYVLARSPGEVFVVYDQAFPEIITDLDFLCKYPNSTCILVIKCQRVEIGPVIVGHGDPTRFVPIPLAKDNASRFVCPLEFFFPMTRPGMFCSFEITKRPFPELSLTSILCAWILVWQSTRKMYDT